MIVLGLIHLFPLPQNKRLDKLLKEAKKEVMDLEENLSMAESERMARSATRELKGQYEKTISALGAEVGSSNDITTSCL